MKKISDFSHTDARRFFLKEQSYCSFALPKYFVFQELLNQISQEIKDKPLSDYYGNQSSNSKKPKSTRPCDYENVNHRFLNNKDGKFSWRPLQLIHPAIYVALVHQISKESNWNLIVKRISEFQSNSRIKCLSLPVESDTSISDKAAAVSNWWQSVEQKSIELALKYQYVAHTDISDCYSSIYTHSIAWALHTREVAKRDRSNKNLLGNIIDSHIQDMSCGQTNGIPQGSVLMDFIAEIVLGYADLELSKRIHKTHINDGSYEILRYRDDYRIFINNPQDGDLILKLLTEVLVDLGLQLNQQKTFSSSHIISKSIKPDKIDWLKIQRKTLNLQANLLLIHEFSYRHPNSGSLEKALDKFFMRTKRLRKNRDDILVLISILVDIIVKNPRVYPIGAAILSKFLSLIDSDEKKVEVLDSIIGKFRLLPNIGYLEIWIQRILVKTGYQFTFGEPMCQKMSKADAVLWNSDWLRSSKLKKILKSCSIVEESTIEAMDEVIEEGEVRLFSSNTMY